ncbi:MAG: MerC family mercury resistance protein [Gammaproteobacteria bacterium]|nr:MerC family mercury resistance protein [Gammaproteobacteria bacterium]
MLAAGPIVSPRRRTAGDASGIAVAVACAFHCITGPLLVAAAPALALDWIEHPGLEWALVVASIGTSALAIGAAWRRHRRWAPLLLVGIGVIGLLTTRLGPELAEETERLAVGASAMALVLAHLANIQMLRHASGRAALVLVGVLAWPTASSAQGGPAPEACFAVEQLPVRERAIAVAMLREASDGEGLYTLAGGLKPVSSDFLTVTWTVAPAVDSVAVDSLAAIRRVAAALRCGPVSAHVLEYAATYTRPDSSRYRVADVFLVHRAGLQRTLTQHAAFWQQLGMTDGADAARVLSAVETAPRAARWRGFGHLFGYPDAAVDFFVEAGESQARTGTFVRRDFRRIETFRKFPTRVGEPPTLSSFVYAVPLGAAPTAADSALEAAAAVIMRRYREQRARFAVEDGEGIVALWRAWIPDAVAPAESVDPFEAPRPTLRAQRAGSAPRIDGRLEHAAWPAATPVSDFHIVRPDYARDAKHATRVRLRYEDDILSVRMAAVTVRAATRAISPSRRRYEQ